MDGIVFLFVESLEMSELFLDLQDLCVMNFLLCPEVGVEVLILRLELDVASTLLLTLSSHLSDLNLQGGKVISAVLLLLLLEGSKLAACLVQLALQGQESVKGH
jgi:hypothetical protein